MQIVESEDASKLSTLSDAAEAERYALMMESILMEPEDLDPVAFPPHRRYFLDGKQAWIYEHGNICELVFVRDE